MSKKGKPPVAAKLYEGTYNPGVRPIPAPLWGENLRTKLGRYRWGKIRQEIIQRRGLKCEVCSKEVAESKKIQAHEEWSYKIVKQSGVAKVERIVITCWHCHMCEHFARLQQMVGQGILQQEVIDDTIAHFCKVNKVSERKFQDHFSASMEIWRELSELRWSVDWGKFEPLVAAVHAGNKFFIAEEFLT